MIATLLALAVSQGPTVFPLRQYTVDPARSSIRFDLPAWIVNRPRSPAAATSPAGAPRRSAGGR